MCCQLLKTVIKWQKVNMKTVLQTDDVQPFVYKCALHFEKTRLHKTLSLMQALWGCTKIPPWLKMRSTGTEKAGTQYIELINGRRHVNDGLHTGVCDRRMMLPRCVPLAYNAGVAYWLGNQCRSGLLRVRCEEWWSWRLGGGALFAMSPSDGLTASWEDVLCGCGGIFVASCTM